MACGVRINFALFGAEPQMRTSNNLSSEKKNYDDVNVG